MRKYLFSTMLSISILLSFDCLFAQDSVETLSIQGDVNKPLQWTVEQLKEQFADKVQDVPFRARSDRPGKIATGVPLLSIIQAAQPKAEKANIWASTKEHHNMLFLVMLEDTTNGYYVFFSAAELMPEFGNEEAWVVWNIDEKPLTEREAPVRLIIPNDKWLDREIFSLNKITIMDGIKLGDQYTEK